MAKYHQGMLLWTLVLKMFKKEGTILIVTVIFVFYALDIFEGFPWLKYMNNL